MTTPQISNIACTLGEMKGSYAEASGFADVLQRESMLRIPDMWGWGNYFATDDIFALAQQSIIKTLEDARILPGDVDLVIFCAAMMPGKASDLNACTAKILQSVGIDSANVMGQTLGGCATTLIAMIMAGELVTANIYHRVLVVALDSLPPELSRFTQFALFSDASISFLVSSGLKNGVEMIASSYHTAISEIINGMGLQDPTLNKASLSQVTEKAAIAVSDIKKVFSNNTFIPVKTLRERSMGFTDQQLDIANVAAIGHCFSCDSLLNYSLYQSSQPKPEEGYFLLFAEADGHAASVLIKEINTPSG